MKTLLSAAWVATMQGPIIRDGAVVIDDDRIAAVGLAKDLTREHPDAALRELGASILLPGLVNAHTHLELSALTSAESPGSFVDWLIRLVRQTREHAGDTEWTNRAVRAGIAQCHRFGVCAVGDVTANPGVTRDELAKHRLRGVSYGEVRGMAGKRNLIEPRLASAASAAVWNPRFRIGISPHAPYSVEPAGYSRSLELARRNGLPLATHIAESAEEARFLADHAGPFRELWRALGGWDEHVPRFDGGPIRFAKDLGLLDYPTLLAHVNYCDDDELVILSRGRASVVYCPRTHAYFAHPPHRWREMLARGINVAVGTDSCVSSPDLNLVDDLRLMHQIAPEFPAQELWQMASTRAARAIQHDDRIGGITPGKFADLVAFLVSTDQPLVEILEANRTPAQLWIGGELIK